MARLKRSLPSASSGVQQPVLMVSMALNDIAKQDDVPRTMYMGILTAVDKPPIHSLSSTKQNKPEETTQTANENTASRCRSMRRLLQKIKRMKGAAQSGTWFAAPQATVAGPSCR